ncbi:MAG TPA: methyltransferase domain-containing protein [Pyrinomonadaceae bacterium]
MRREEVNLYVCPETRKPLALKSVGEEAAGGEVESGTLASADGREYRIRRGMPDLTFPPDLSAQDEQARSFYDGRAEAYDKYLHLTFKTHGEDEHETRNKFIDALDLRPAHRVLEVSCGTGRDSEIIARRLGPEGRLCLQDIASGMLDRCRERLAGVPVPVSYCVSNACYLPYPDNYFDAVYSFGGLGEFSDIRRSLAEMARVGKVGAKVVVGDESIPPWLRETEFAKILVTTNKQFLANVPLAEMPVEAREVCLRWVIGGVFYLIEFTVGEGEPTGDFDFEIPGPRGGTYRTRYLGQLEGVTPETKRLAEQAREKLGVSMHDWLDEVVRRAALSDLGGGGQS